MLLSLLFLVQSSIAPAAAAAPAPVLAQDEDAVRYDDVQRAAVKTMIAELEEYASWCLKSKVIHQRNLGYWVILDWDADHKVARKALGYKWSNKEDKWLDPRKARKAKDRSKDNVVLAAEKREAILTKFKDRLMGALDADETQSKAKRQRVLDQLLKALPNDADLRTRNGQALRTGSEEAPVWILKESKRALDWIDILDKRKDELFAKVPGSEPITANDNEAGLGITWSVLQGNDRIRILSTGGLPEADKTLTICHALWDYTRDLFGHKLDPRFTVYLIDNPEDKTRFINKWPGLPADLRKMLERMAGLGLSSKHSAQWGETEEKRVDGSCRQTLGVLMNTRFGVGPDQGWAIEGFGMYITHKLVGTRLTFFVQQSKYDDQGGVNLDRMMRDPNSDWLSMAKEQLNKDSPPNLAFTVGRDINTLTAIDLLMSYALASYFLEGSEPAVTQSILSGLGEGKNPVETMERVLGYDMRTLAERLRIYLEEIGK